MEPENTGLEIAIFAERVAPLVALGLKFQRKCYVLSSRLRNRRRGQRSWTSMALSCWLTLAFRVTRLKRERRRGTDSLVGDESTSEKWLSSLIAKISYVEYGISQQT